MKKVVLLFPDTSGMANFIQNENIGNADVSTMELSLIAPLTDRQMVEAETVYKAVLKTMIPQN